MTEPRRLLIVRLTAIGDVVHALPAANALRRHCPDARIDWLVDKRAAAMLQGVGWLDRVIVLDGKGLLRKPLRAWSSIRELRQRRYDAAFDLQGLFKSALMTSLSRSRETIGFARQQLREPFAAALYSRRAAPPPTDQPHVIARSLALVGEWLGRPEVVDEPWQFFDAQASPEMAARETALRGQLAVHGNDAGSLIVVNPGAAWRTKRWPPERFAELVRRLLTEPLPAGSGGGEPRIMITWGPREEPARDAISQHVPPDLRSRLFDFPTALSDLVPLFRIATLFVGGDTGPMQSAAAVGTPVVSLFGPTWPDRNGPFSAADRAATVWHRLPCSGCYGKRCPLLPRDSQALPPCIDRITVDEVLAAVHQRLRPASE